MNLIRSLMGRRQFIVAAGMAPAVALSYEKLTNFINPGFQTNAAMAAEKNKKDEKRGNIDTSRYSHLMSPLRIGNVILKNRIFSTNGSPHFLQGGENFPAEPSRFYNANLAKNGAAIVTPRMIWGRERKEQIGDSAHMVIYDLDDTGVQNYLAQLIEGIHCFGAKATIPLYVLTPDQETIPPGPEHTVEPLSDEIEEQLIEEAVRELKVFQGLGYDMTTLQMVQYIGDNKQRERFSVRLCRAIKKALGQDFLIGSRITMVDTDTDRQRNTVAYTPEDIIGSAKQWEGLIDILQLMAGVGFMGFSREKGAPPPALKYAQKIKESGAKIFTAPNGGFGDLDQNNQYIMEEKADIIAMATQLIVDWEYGKKMTEGRGEDRIPCIGCNKCHGFQNPPWLTVCSVNPKLGIDSAVRIIDKPAFQKKVAVIGGGPAGMKAAMTAVERGHKVTLYEKSGSLGGMLRHADYSDFKWPLMDFKDYLVRQVKKAGVELLLNSTATPEMIKSKKYDAIIVAIGAEPNIPRIPGTDANSVYDIDSVYGREKELGENVVIVGAGSYSIETAIYLGRAGHNVTVLASGKDLVERSGPHQLDTFAMIFRNMKNCSSIMDAVTKSVANGKVTYRDDSGREKSIQADSVVIYAGLKPRLDEAMKFSGSAGQIFLIGNCSGSTVDGVQATQRDAFFAASQV